MAQVSAIADLFRELEGPFKSLAPAVREVIIVIGAYSLSFVVIRFIIFIFSKPKRDRLSNRPATLLSVLLATFLWPAFLSIFAGLSTYWPIGLAEVLDAIVFVLGVWLGTALLFAPVSSAIGLLLLVAYLVKVKRLSPQVIYIFVTVAMFLQCLYVLYADLDPGSK